MYFSAKHPACRHCSGDQDSVVPLLGSRTLVRELAHDLNFSTTLPYWPWFHKDQVSSLLHCNDAKISRSQFSLLPLQLSQADCKLVVVWIVMWLGWWLGHRVWRAIDVCNGEGSGSYGALCAALTSSAFIQWLCAWPEIAQ